MFETEEKKALQDAIERLSRIIRAAKKAAKELEEEEEEVVR
ncbi:MAG: hypothetical protein DDT19_01722 [Syntrophomonadaceae bacterium]|nr:hypothetical protein [Bacillota bacterium]